MFVSLLCLYQIETLSIIQYLHSNMSNRCDQTYVIKTDFEWQNRQWAYALVEYDLACEPLKFMRDQIVADFIVEYRINDKHDLEVGYIACTPWKLYFDGSVCDDGQGIGAVLIFLNSAVFEFSNRLEE